MFVGVASGHPVFHQLVGALVFVFDLEGCSYNFNREPAMSLGVWVKKESVYYVVFVLQHAVQVAVSPRSSFLFSAKCSVQQRLCKCQIIEQFCVCVCASLIRSTEHWLCMCKC